MRIVAGSLSALLARSFRRRSDWPLPSTSASLAICCHLVARVAGCCPMIDDAAKANLYNYLKHEREAVLAKLDGLSEYDVRRPLTVTGTNLLGLVKHLATWEARYLGEVFGRPFPEPLPRWDVEAERLADMWATERESRSDVVDRYRRVWEHSDATVDALALDATGRVAWWQDAEVPLFNILVHLLAETSRHAGHADILREAARRSGGNRRGGHGRGAARPSLLGGAARGDRGGRQVSQLTVSLICRIVCASARGFSRDPRRTIMPRSGRAGFFGSQGRRT